MQISFSRALDYPDVEELRRKTTNTDEAARRGVELHHLQTHAAAVALGIGKLL